ncbi:hypothetical protein DFH09DRAFT_1301326 [Mycena vulgaris]|nr:hypothetical protein DFH09DRAFT_1301326 [Mycena vulgaris]
MSDQCALDANGNLREAEDIEFYASSLTPKPCLQHRAAANFVTSLADQKADDDGNPFIKAPRRARVTTKKSTRVKAVPESPSDEEDEDYPDLIDASDSEDSDSKSEMAVDNDEIASILPSRTVPGRSKSTVGNPQTRGKTSTATSASKRKQTSDSASAPAAKKTNRVTIEEVQDEGDTPTKATVTKNPIYLFYEVVPKNAVGYAGSPGDKHYKAGRADERQCPVTLVGSSSVNSTLPSTC